MKDRRFKLGGPPLALQIMGLLIGGLMVAQFVTLVLTVILPPSPPPQYELADIAATLAGASDEGRSKNLQRLIQAGPPDVHGPGWLVSEGSRRELASLMGVEEGRVSLAFYTPLPFAGVTGPRTLAMANDGQMPALRRADAKTRPADFLRMQFTPTPGGTGMPGQPIPFPQLGERPGGMMPNGGVMPGPFRRGPGESRRPPMTVPRGAGSAIDRARPLLSVEGQGRAAVRLPDYAEAPAGTVRSQGLASGATPNLLTTAPGTQVVAGAVRTQQLAQAADIPPTLLGPGATRIPGPTLLRPGLADRALLAPVPSVGSAVRTAPQVNTTTITQPTAARAAPQPTTRSAPLVLAPAPLIGGTAIQPVPSAASQPTPAAPRLEPAPSGPSIRITPQRRALFGLAPAPFVEGDFVAAMKLGEARWIVVQPATQPFPNAWQRRVLLWFAIALALVAPVGWLFARHLVKPIDRFAGAAEQLGRDPSAEIGALDGPAEIGRAAHAFNLMQNRLRAFVDDRTAMVGAISHDLRTPLTRMRFRLEDVDDGEVREGLLEEVDEMEAMIAQVINFLRDASAPAKRERLDLSTLVEDVVEDVRLVGGEVTVEHVECARVEVDVLGMKRLIDNLLENAVKYGVRARVRLRTDMDEAVAEILDDGPGLPPEEYERVFEPFYRSEAARSSDKAGSGLGLAVCRSIARAHGGDIRLKQTPDGFAAELRVPLVYGSEKPIPA